MKKNRSSWGRTGAKKNRPEQSSSSYCRLPPKIKYAIASDQSRQPRPISLPQLKWLQRPVLR
jgi:hypothetical protein